MKKIHKRCWRRANTKCIIINFYVKLLCLCQCCGSRSKEMMTTKWKKIQRNFIKIFFLIKICIYSYRKSLQPSKENIQHFKEWNLIYSFWFCGSFLPSWIWIRIQGPHWIRIPNTDFRQWAFLIMIPEQEVHNGRDGHGEHLGQKQVGCRQRHCQPGGCNIQIN